MANSICFVYEIHSDIISVCVCVCVLNLDRRRRRRQPPEGMCIAVLKTDLIVLCIP